QTPAHSKAETEAFADEVVDVTEKVQESEKPQPVEPEPAAALETAAPQIAVEREELPLPEEVKDEALTPQEWQAEADTGEVIAAVDEEG
ncbi:signal recognition particle-docking protein FtsY, partial [Salmonella enterica subsp. enterica serovar Infantis]